jgi:hypothetical protein
MDGGPLMSAPHGHSAPVEVEPQTPMWLPALGAALFIAFGLWIIVSVPSAGEAAPGAPSTAGQAAPAR